MPLQNYSVDKIRKKFSGNKSRVSSEKLVLVTNSRNKSRCDDCIKISFHAALEYCIRH